MARKAPILFHRYPELQDKVPWIPIGNLPTPTQELSELEAILGYQSIWIKRDDLTGRLYGGSKVRKLEFILGDVIEHKKKWILTFGGLGTNHGLATAIYGREHQLKTVLALIDQPVTAHVQDQLLLFDYYGAKISYAKNKVGAVLKALWHLATKRGVYFLWPGGSTKIGNLGYINAGLELAEQIEQGNLPSPDRIYVALGSMGTFAGLFIGLKLAGLKTELIGVRVTDLRMTNEKNTAKMINQTIRYLKSLSDSFPKFEIKPEDLEINHDYAGLCYGSVTEKGLEAVDILKRTHDIQIETTYTAKAFACMIDDIKAGRVGGESILFWNTYSSVDLSHIVQNHSDYSKLPRSFHRFFSNIVSTNLE